MSSIRRYLFAILLSLDATIAGRAADVESDLPAGALVRLGDSRFQHPGGIFTMALLPDGKSVLTGGRDGTIRVWDSATGKEQRCFGTLRTAVTTMALSRDGTRLAAAGFRLTLFDVASGKELGRSDRPISYNPTAFLGDHVLAVGNGLVFFFDAKTGQQVRMLRVEPLSNVLAVSPDEKLYAVATLRGKIHVMETAAEKARQVMTTPTGTAYALAFSPDGRMLASAENREVGLWDLATGKRGRAIAAGDGVRALAYSPNGKFLATGSLQGPVRLWHVESGREVRVCEVRGSTFIRLAFAADGETLYTSDGITVRPWDVGLSGLKGDPARWTSAPAQARLAQAGHAGGVTCAGFTPDGRVLLTQGTDQRVLRWEVATGRLLGECKGIPNPQSLHFANGMVVMPDGKSLLLNRQRGSLSLCDTITGRETRRVALPADVTASPVVSPSGRMLTFGIAHNVHLYDAATLRPLRAWAAHHDLVVGVAFSPNGRALASLGADRALCLWDLASGKERIQISEADSSWVSNLTFSPDGRTLAIVVNNKLVHLWDATTGKRAREFSVPAIQVQAVAFSPDGLYLAASYMGAVTLWETASGREVVRFNWDQPYIGRLVFSPDGRVLAACGGASVMLWDVTGLRTGKAGPAVRTPADLDRAWEELTSRDPTLAHRALWALADAPEQAVPFLASRLIPAIAPSEKQIRDWAEKLVHADRQTREAAETELEALGEAARALMQRMQQTTSSSEVYVRTGQWLDGLGGPIARPTVLRELRALAVVERVASGTSDAEPVRAARQLLSKLAAGETQTRLTVAARLALDRRQPPDARFTLPEQRAEKQPPERPQPAPGRIVRQLGETMFLPEEYVASVTFRPGDTTLALAVTGNTVRLWDALTYKELKRWPAPVHSETPLAFSPDGKLLFVGGPDGVLRRWEVDPVREVTAWQGHTGRVAAMVFSPDGKLVASGCEKTVIVRDASNGQVAWRLDVRDRVSGLAFSPDGKLLAGCYGDSTLLWEVAGGKEKGKLPTTSIIRWLAFTPDGKKLLARGPRRYAVAWDLDRGKPSPVVLGNLLPEHPLALSPDGKLMAVSRATGELHLVDPGAGQRVRALLGMGPVRMQPHPDPDRGEELIVVGEADRVTTASFSTDGKYLATAGTDRRVRVFDLAKSVEVPADRTSPVLAIAFGKDGSTLVAAGADHRVRTWNLRNGKLLHEHAFGAGRHRNLVLSANGEVLAVSGLSREAIQLRRTTPRREAEAPFPLRAGLDFGRFTSPVAIAMSGDGKSLAVADFANVLVWEPPAQNPRVALELKPRIHPRGMAFTPDGRTLGITDTSGIILVDVAGKRLWPALQGRRGYLGPPAFSADGHSVYAGYGDDAFCQWEVATGKFRSPLVEIPGGSGNQMCLSPDQRTLVAATRDHALHFWDARTSKSLGRLRQHTATIRALAFSPDGTLLASASDDGTVLVWELAERGEAAIEKPATEAMAGLWAELASSNGSRAWRAMLALEGAGEEAVALFERHLRPAGGPDAKQLAGLIANLDNDAFAVRVRASEELEALGALAHPALRKALEGKPDPEVKSRIEKLLALPVKPVTPPDRLPALRALEVLERVASPQARKLIAALAGGDKEDPLTVQAQAAQQRLAARTPRPR